MRTCIVVDDSSVVRKVARRILEHFDFTVSEAEDGAQAIALCQRTLPDMVLLDASMPIMDGYEFLRGLRRMPGGDRPKVIMCRSTTTTPRSRARIMSARTTCCSSRSTSSAWRQSSPLSALAETGCSSVRPGIDYVRGMSRLLPLLRDARDAGSQYPSWPEQVRHDEFRVIRF